ncbi:unnamed protein product [Tuber melanosporum]|uniref:(Perigord truffle) hypothetical protein n=1 Tax=Tuber melanosporum (strain Mel28) TaxID=656061 RepID=D5G4G7_TUBMM|nr:uncharacterized protein GSTUM_00004099001 [Tuber melanosporum]CAZ79410.1 unnamed protein product [Tuber melanosporum]
MKVTILFLATLLSAALSEPIPWEVNGNRGVYRREPEAEAEAWHPRAGDPMAIWQKRNAEPYPEAEPEAIPWTPRPGRGAYRRHARPWTPRPGRGAYRRSAEAWHPRAGPPAYTLSKRDAAPEPVRFQPIGSFYKE